MYAVVMAGGGGTRLHPLSRPERPKPFLPLLGDQSLLQATVARLPTDDVTVVTDARYERSSATSCPMRGSCSNRCGRNTAAAIALATVAIDRPDDEVMLVVPADAHVDGRGRAIATSCARAAAAARHGRLRDSRLHSSPSARRSIARRPTTATSSPTSSARGGDRGTDGLSAPSVRGEAQRAACRTISRRRPASPGTRASSCGGAGPSAPRSSAIPG